VLLHVSSSSSWADAPAEASSPRSMLPPPTCTVNDPSGSTPGQRLLRSDADGSGPLDGISVPSYVPTGVVRWINPAAEQLLATLVVVTTPRSSRPIGG